MQRNAQTQIPFYREPMRCAHTLENVRELCTVMCAREKRASVRVQVGEVSTSTEDPHQPRTLSTFVTLHVSRDCVLTTFVAHDEFFPCGEANARDWVSGNTSPQPLYNKRICHQWKKSVCQQLKLLQTRINDTDRLTVLYVYPQPYHTTYNDYTFTSFTAREMMMAERTAVRFEKSKDARKYMTIDAGERSSRVPGWDREADAYLFCTRRALQDDERT